MHQPFANKLRCGVLTLTLVPLNFGAKFGAPRHSDLLSHLPRHRQRGRWKGCHWLHLDLQLLVRVGLVWPAGRLHRRDHAIQDPSQGSYEVELQGLFTSRDMQGSD